MKRLADDLYLLRGFPPYLFNVYLMGGVLVDAATHRAGRRILRELEGHAVIAHALTHAHPDHQGASHEVCTRLDIPYWCGEADVVAAETGAIAASQPPAAINRLFERLMAGPGHPVARALKEGDEVGGFEVLSTPGHSRGHLSFWRESDRSLVCGDVFFNMNPLTGIPGLHEPPEKFTSDPVQNRQSERRLAALDPALVCFGHGPVLRDPAKLAKFVAARP